MLIFKIIRKFQIGFMERFVAEGSQSKEFLTLVPC